MKNLLATPTPVHSVEGTVDDLQEQIRLRAYELYQQRGGEGGSDIADWLRAESDVAHKEVTAIAA